MSGVKLGSGVLNAAGSADGSAVAVSVGTAMPVRVRGVRDADVSVASSTLADCNGPQAITVVATASEHNTNKNRDIDAVYI
jgi:hypothetical protein